MNDGLTARFERIARVSMRTGIVGLACAVLLAFVRPGSFFVGYLAAFLFVCGIPLGCGAILFLHHLVPGRWGQALRPCAETGVLTTPLLAIGFIPVLLGMTQLYPWTAKASALPDVVARKEIYLNIPFFVARAAFYFVVWSLGAWWIGRRGRRPIVTADAPSYWFAPRYAAAGLIVYGLTMSFAAVDWIGSLAPEWFTSVVGLYLLVGQALTAMAVMTLAITALLRSDAASEPNASFVHDLGNFMLLFVILHAYLAYSQFFIIWNGNLPDEIGWYLPRMRGFWEGVSVLLIGIHFALPFALLLSRRIKRSVRPLMWVAAWILFARVVDCIWFVLPSCKDGGILAGIECVAALVGLCGIWAAIATRMWARRPAMIGPFVDPRLAIA